MNDLYALLNTLREKKIYLSSDLNGLKIDAPEQALTQDLIYQIKEKKAELLSFLETVNGDRRSALLQKAEQKSYYPLSSSQLSFFSVQLLFENNTAYNMPQLVEFSLEPDYYILKRSFQILIARHEILRTAFQVTKEGQFVQHILGDLEILLDVFTANSEDEMSKYIEAFVRPFELDKPPLFRASIINFKDRRYLLFDSHHIISDGISNQILFDELELVYNGENLIESSFQYVDFSEWQNKRLYDGGFENQERFWRNFLGKHTPQLDLPSDYSFNDTTDFKGENIQFELEEDISYQLRSLAIQEGVTLNYLLLTLYSILLHKYSNQSEFHIGTVVSGRRDEELFNILGSFVMHLPIRIEIETEETFELYLKKCEKVFSETYANQDYPFEKIVELANLPADPTRNPLFNTMLIFHNESDVVSPKLLNSIFKWETVGWNKGGQLIQQFRKDNTSKMDLVLDVFDNKEEGFMVSITYSTHLFKLDTIQSLGRRFEKLIKDCMTKPWTRIADLRLITEEEQAEVLGFNENNLLQSGIPHLISFLDKDLVGECLFEDAISQYHGSEIIRDADRVAGFLIEKGLKKGDVVAIYFDRSIEMLSSIIGIIKAGCVYLPLATNLPKSKLDFILLDSNAQCIISQNSEPFADIKTTVFSTHEISKSDTTFVSSDIRSEATDLMYIMYTSGSSGNPKGVKLRYDGVMNRLIWGQKKWKLDSLDVILFKTPYYFDVSVPELFWGFISGAKTVFLPSNQEANPLLILEYIERFGITQLHFVPSMLSAFLDYVETVDIKRLKTLKRVFASGEALTESQVCRFNKLLYESFGTRLINLYGPTEASIEVTCFECTPYYAERYKSVPIGTPLDNVRTYILDNNLNLQPVGFAGELFISGVSVAEGYLNRPELNKKHFLPDPFLKGRTMYRTGDWVRWLPNGVIEFLGRKDGQVKIRGVRIELGEIEETLKGIASLKEVVVVVKGSIEKNDQKLIAYYTSDQEVSILKLRAFSKLHLPVAYIPSSFIQIDSIPLTPSGKMDRKYLTLLNDNEVGDRVVIAPKTELEVKISEIWKEVLGFEKISVEDDFFMIGGNSLLAIRAIALIKQRLGLEIGIRDFINKSLGTICSTYDNR